jgi:hypothetical protein
VDVPGCGLCWRPPVVVYDGTWQPYCDHRHWVYTDAGWYWLSDYSWGATTFHYGRWFHDSHYGWCWWPDTEWAPSWVTWRYSDDYCGWAPLPPHAVYREGVGIFYNGVAVSAGFDFGLNVNFFTFVPTGNFCDPHPRRYVVAPAEVTRIYNRTTIINNYNVNSHDRTFVNNGIPPQRISAVTHAEIRPVTLRETAAPVMRGEQPERNGGPLTVYRPHFDAGSVSALNNGVRPTPTRPIAPRTESPGQNNFSQPNRGWSTAPTPAVTLTHPTTRPTPEHGNVHLPAQQPSAGYYSPPAPTPNPNYDPDKHIYSPRQQQIQQQTPPVITRSTPERQAAQVPAAPVERPQNSDTRQNYQPPAQLYSAPPAQNNSGSPGSQRSNGKQNQNGFGN